MKLLLSLNLFAFEPGEIIRSSDLVTVYEDLKIQADAIVLDGVDISNIDIDLAVGSDITVEKINEYFNIFSVYDTEMVIPQFVDGEVIKSSVFVSNKEMIEQSLATYDPCTADITPDTQEVDINGWNMGYAPAYTRDGQVCAPAGEYTLSYNVVQLDSANENN